MIANAFECQYEVGYEMVDGCGVMKPRTVIELFMESAIKNCLSAGYSVFDMLKDGVGWVLRGGNYIIGRLPGYAEKIKVRTWISSWSSFQGSREFVLTDENDRELISCSSVWAMFDLVKRVPHKVAEIFKSKWNFNEAKATTVAFLKRPFQMAEEISKKDISVMRHDMDSNKHVHNLSYVDWVFDALPEDYLKKKLVSISGTFLKEISGASAVRCVVGKDVDGNLIHNIVSLDESVIYATGKTEWA